VNFDNAVFVPWTAPIDGVPAGASAYTLESQSVSVRYQRSPEMWTFGSTSCTTVWSQNKSYAPIGVLTVGPGAQAEVKLTIGIQGSTECGRGANTQTGIEGWNMRLDPSTLSNGLVYEMSPSIQPVRYAATASQPPVDDVNGGELFANSR
jgi:hypothetical protein